MPWASKGGCQGRGRSECVPSFYSYPSYHLASLKGMRSKRLKGSTRSYCLEQKTWNAQNVVLSPWQFWSISLKNMNKLTWITPFRYRCICKCTPANLKQEKAMQVLLSCGRLLWDKGGRLLWEERQSWSGFDPLSLKIKRKNNQTYAENVTANKLWGDIWTVWFSSDRVTMSAYSAVFSQSQRKVS